MNMTMVVNELLRAWRESDDPEAYARTVLADIEFGEREVKVRGWHTVLLLHHLRGLHSLHVLGDLTPLVPVAEIPNLRRLNLFQNYALRDLTPLQRSENLRALKLTGCTFLRDLSPLRETALAELHLYHMEAPDLATLGGARISTLVIRDDRLADGLNLIPQGLPLEQLLIDNLADRRNLRGVGKWPTLLHVGCNGVPDREELAELTRLPELKTMAIRTGGAGAVDGESRSRVESYLGGIQVTWT